MARCVDLIGIAACVAFVLADVDDGGDLKDALLAVLFWMSKEAAFALAEPPGLRRAGDEDGGFQVVLLTVPALSRSFRIDIG